MPLRNRTLLRLLSALFMLGLLLAACGDDDGDQKGSDGAAEPAADSGDESAGDGKVEIVDFTYEPTEITVSAGTEVTFTNMDDQAHTATSKDTGVFDTDSIADGGDASISVDEPGTYEFTCSFHPFMKGTLVVE